MKLKVHLDWLNQRPEGVNKNSSKAKAKKGSKTVESDYLYRLQNLDISDNSITKRFLHVSFPIAKNKDLLSTKRVSDLEKEEHSKFILSPEDAIEYWRTPKLK